MNIEIKELIKAKNQWENDIKIYKQFLQHGAQTFEGRNGAQEYILMAENKINDINKKLQEIEKKS